MQKAGVDYPHNSAEAKFINEKDSNLRDIPVNTSMQKPDSQYLQDVNKISCDNNDILVQDNSNNSYQQDNYYCYNNNNKKLVQWKKINGLWVQRHLTNSSEYKEINNNVCKVITPGCDSMNPAQGCQVKCFLNDKTTQVFTANYDVLPN
jgi:hypothetical protein